MQGWEHEPGHTFAMRFHRGVSLLSLQLGHSAAAFGPLRQPASAAAYCIGSWRGWASGLVLGWQQVGQHAAAISARQRETRREVRHGENDPGKTNKNECIIEGTQAKKGKRPNNKTKQARLVANNVSHLRKQRVQNHAYRRTRSDARLYFRFDVGLPRHVCRQHE